MQHLMLYYHVKSFLEFPGDFALWDKFLRE